MEHVLDYNTYKELSADLLYPIDSPNLNKDITKRLYESKLVYLENLRIKCFKEINTNLNSEFSQDDYLFILEAKKKNYMYLRDVVLDIIRENLKNIK